MFTMMNNARLNVGLQGVSIAERATQRAVAYALERKQGQRDGRPVPIVEHPDVRRMLLRMRALTKAARALVYYASGQVDRAARRRREAAARADLLTPLAKAWGTDVGCEVASLGVQVHGGMGYHRGDRRRPAFSRRPDRADLRRHQRHPGGRPGRRKLGLEGGAAFDGCSPTCAPKRRTRG